MTLTDVPCPTCGRDRWVCNYPSTVAKTAHSECMDCGIRTRSNSRRRTYRERAGIVDWVVIDRLCNGTPVPYSTSQERREAMLILLRRGFTGEAIAARTGVAERTVQRLRARMRVTA